ncbi:MAG: twin-arginine translocation pathway signal [Rhodobacteraceae bacterium]|nr:twin-arginine translocation pathway signal [Paracoccaceae bacterium]
MNIWNRRAFLGSVAAGSLSACTGGTDNVAQISIDDKVADAVQQMQNELPFIKNLLDNAAGVLIVPTVTKASFILGGSYGEGALLIGEAPVAYYSVVAASYGIQAGGHQYSSALFFMDSEHLAKFRGGEGWTLGTDLEFTVLDDSLAAGIDNNTIDEAVYAVLFNQAGILVGVSVEGSKYTPIER